MEVRTCVVCGKEFVTKNHRRTSCSPECRKIFKANYKRERRAKIKGIPVQSAPMRDLKLYEILEIMDMYDLPIQEYLDKREFYKELYLMRKRSAE